jgi:outer membrane immunogenic protein
MKKLWLAAVAGLALSTSAAFAADLGRPYYKAPPPPPVVAPSWTGFYIGVNGGYGWGNRTGDLFCAGGVVCQDTTGTFLRPQGGLAGGQLGYNWQSGIVVYGIEADIQWADIRNSSTVFLGPGLIDTLSASDRLDWFGTVRGRIGLTPWSQNALVYVTGGLIYGGQRVSATLVTPGLGPCFTAGCFASNSTTRTGGTVGGGFEYLFTPNLSAKVEGLWFDMGSRDLFINNVESERMRLQGVIVRAGLNWHFNWGGNEYAGGPLPH